MSASTRLLVVSEPDDLRGLRGAVRVRLGVDGAEWYGDERTFGDEWVLRNDGIEYNVKLNYSNSVGWGYGVGGAGDRVRRV